MSWKSLLIAACAFATLGCASPPTQPESRLQLVDLTDDFARIYDRDAALPDAERVRRFRAEFGVLLPGFYDAARLKAPQEKYNEYLAKRIKEFPAQRSGIERVSRDFTALLAPAQRSFEAEFGPLTGYPPVYLVNSLGEFDGGTRDLPEGTRLMFGADVIARLYQTTPIQPFFHHELFHLLHNRTFPVCEPIWCGVWTEGLAVYVASRLNPDADDAALLLTFPVPLRAAVERDRVRAVCAVASRLESIKDEDYKGLFSSGQVDPKLPGRFAYYIGFLVARDAGRTRSLKELAALQPAQVRPLVEQSLARMANCRD
jgi:hypothetical protein